MPNTLAHIAVHTPITRALIRGVDYRWLLLGCVISDLPWIFQRAVWMLLPSIDRIDMRLYAIVQASLFGSIFLAAGLSRFSSERRKVFFTLLLGIGLHLTLDAFQNKWGNAVHLLAPFSWKSLSFGWFWPEGWQTIVLTLAGFGGFVWAIRLPGRSPLAWPTEKKFAAGMLLAYFLVPFAFMSMAERSGTHSLNVFRNVDQRKSKEVWIDRCQYDDAMIQVSFLDERIQLARVLFDHPAQVSLHAVFTDKKTLKVIDFHEHKGFRRDIGSYAGLLLVLVAWVLPRKVSAA